MQKREYSKTIVTVDAAINALKEPPEALHQIRTYVMYQSGKITSILDGIRAKNGFEVSKRVRSGKGKRPEETERSFCRPVTAAAKTQRTAYLYPEYNKSIVQVKDLDAMQRRGIKGIIRMVSCKSSPQSRAKSPVVMNRSQVRSKKDCVFMASSREFEKEEPARNGNQLIQQGSYYGTGLVQRSALDRLKRWGENGDTRGGVDTDLEVHRKCVGKDGERGEKPREGDDANGHEFISSCNIKMLIEEFNKSDRSLEKIDKIALKLEFLQKFPLAMRESLYKSARIENFSEKQVIFNEGNSEDYMFVIIKGSVVIHKRLNEVRNYPIIITSLYNGLKLGDVSILNTTSEEEAHKCACVVTRPATIFILPKVEYKALLFQFLKPELESKVNLLLKVRLFQEIELSTLYTLASTTETVHVSVGECILQKGEKPKGLYIINKGHVEVVTSGYVENKRHTSMHGSAKIRAVSSRHYYIGTRSLASAPKGKMREVAENTNSSLIDGGDEDIDGSAEEKIPNFILHPTEFFGGKAVLDGGVFAGRMNEVGSSRFAFIAKSSGVELFIISKEQMTLLNPKAELIVKDLLSKSFHIDCPEDVDSELVDELFIDWQEYKEKL